VLVALPGEEETCLANVQRWHRTAEENGFILVAVNLNDDAVSQERGKDVAEHLPGIVERLAGHYELRADRRYLCGRGASAREAWKAAFEDDGFDWAGVILLGGIEGLETPEVEGRTNTPFVYCVTGMDDTDLSTARKLLGNLEEKGIAAHGEYPQGNAADAVLDFNQIWRRVAQSTQEERIS
jgi:hypothetical protein